MSQSQVSYVIAHGAFARPARQELMEIAVLQAGHGPRGGYRSLVRCDQPDTPQNAAEDGNAPGVSEEANRNAPTAGEVFAHVNRAFALGQATVVMWAGMPYRIHKYAGEKRVPNPFSQTRVVDLQAAVVMHLNLKTSDCKSPHSIMRLLDLNPKGHSWSQGPLPFVHAMNAVLGKLIADGWTPEATPAAVMNGCDIGEQAEEMRLERWEQIRERQNNLGVERRAIPDVAPAFIVLDGEHVQVRNDRGARLIEVALVVAHRKERHGRAAYELADKPFTSLVQFLQVNDTHSYAWEMTGIDPDDVRKAPSLARVIAGMVAAAPWDGGVLVTWGPDDACIITQNCAKAGFPSPIAEVPLIDLQRVFSRFYNMGPQQISLQNAAAFLGVDTNGLNLHRALPDTQITWQVLERMLADGWTPQWRPWHREQQQQQVG